MKVVPVIGLLKSRGLRQILASQLEIEEEGQGGGEQPEETSKCYNIL